jgi:prolyl-tRNA editing enzyme YbaK/EbsC (Cys-tRNA(Pro) deacylase)
VTLPSAKPLPASAERVQHALAAAGLDSAVVELAVAARTSQQAADALGIEVGQIAKSLIFRAVPSGRAVLVIAAGDRRVDEARIGALVGETIERAPPEFVREHSGFAIGGVAPLAHPAPLTTLIDEHLLKWDRIWAAAGHPHTVFPLAPPDLVRITGGRVISVT